MMIYCKFASLKKFCLLWGSDSEMARQLQNGFGIRGREAAIGRLQVGQPGMGDVLAWTEDDGVVAWHSDRKHVLGVLRYARGVTVAPEGIDLVDIG